ncbi:hydrogenase formation protein HypD [Helicobacter jaachi]|nr:hydrogenase formation protein HypD [Helicobacter jaachi]
MLKSEKKIDLIHNFRDKDVILGFAKKINTLSSQLQAPLCVMEVCGGHTHSIMRYGLQQLLPKNIAFIHGPGCPVCIMPKNRINQAYEIAMQKDVILLTLGDMIKVPGVKGSLSTARAKGADVRFLYSPMQVLDIAKDNPHKRVVYFAIGFETTTPMSAALIERVIESRLTNVFFHINHVLVPPPVRAILDSKQCRVNALIAPSHVSVITGAKIYKDIALQYKIPIVVSGFEPVDIMESLYMIVQQGVNKEANLDIQYKRVVSMEGNLKAQSMVERYFEKRKSFEWRGLGEITESALRLKPAYTHLDAEVVFSSILSTDSIPDNKACRCGDILRGVAKPLDCKVFGKSCTPSNPLGSCMVSSEGACAAYYKYGDVSNL